jgi:uncharacterized iron-regulated membrane protein
MKGGLRKSMTWLHTWSSLIVIWILFAIFLTGTTSFFRAEITHWMTPEHHVSTAVDQPLHAALEYLESVAPYGETWQISLPDSRSPVLSLNWQAEGEERQRRRGARAVLDPATGDAIDEARDTAGGNFLFRFHYELYGVPRGVGQWIVGIASMLMFIAIISGIIMHRKIFADFFSFRPGKKTASWLDAHVVGSVLALPFHIMITFTGLFLLAGTLLFWQGGNERGGNQGQGQQQGPQQGQQEGQRQGRQQAGSEGHSHENAQVNTQRGAQEGRVQNTDQNRPESRAESRTDIENPRTGRRQQQAIPASAEREPIDVDLDALFQQAEALLNQSVADITVTKPMTDGVEIRFRGSEKSHLSHFRGGIPEVSFNADGDVIKENYPSGAEGAVATTYGVLRSLHEGHFADIITRWLLFFAGVLGTVMVGSGALLWSQKRQRQLAGKRGFELVSALNLAGIAGMFVALGAYFWANRIIPVDIEDRGDLEIATFFSALLLCLVYAVFFRNKHGWLIQLAVAGVLFVLLPVLDFLTSPVGLTDAIAGGDWVRLSFDLIALLTALGLWTAVYYLIKKARTTNNKPVKSRAPQKPMKDATV